MLKAGLIRWIKWTVIVSAVGFVVGERLWAFFSPSPALVISPATTWITEPLAPDGLPDFFQAFLALEPRGIPAESNAAAAVWELIPSNKSSDNVIDHSPAHLSAADRLPAAERLVMPPPPPHDMEAEDARKVLESCTRGAWRAADHPWLARWLDDNAAAIDRLAAGARREGWCPPRCLPTDQSPTTRFGKQPIMLPLSLPVEDALLSMSGALLARSMLRLGEGDAGGAWSDLDALLRYGDKISDAPGTLIGRAVAMRLFFRASRAVGGLILDGHPDDMLLAEIRRSLRSSLDFPSLAEALDGHERLYALDAITFRFANPSRPLPMSPFGRLPYRVFAADPNVPLREANELLDTMVYAVGLPTRELRQGVWQVFHDHLDSRGNAELRPRQWFEAWREVYSERLSGRTMKSFLPEVKTLLEDTDRTQAALVLVDSAAALERYRLAKREPPPSLADLVPAFLPAIPIDPLTDAPLGYRSENGRWTLWSGTEPSDDDVDELVLRGPGDRMPLESKLPDPPPPDPSPEAPSPP